MRDEQRGKKGRGSRSSEEGKEKVHKLTKEGSILVCPGSTLIEPEAPVPCVGYECVCVLYYSPLLSVCVV